MTEYFALHGIDRIPDYLASLALESAVQDLKHGLLIDVVLVVDLLEEAVPVLSLSLSEIFGIDLGQLINLLIHFLQFEVVLRGVRTRAVGKGVVWVVFFLDFHMVIGRLQLLVFEVVPPV